jgi:hypothetical protein
MATATHTQFGSRTLPCIVVTDEFDTVLSWSPVV